MCLILEQLFPFHRWELWSTEKWNRCWSCDSDPDSSGSCVCAPLTMLHGMALLILIAIHAFYLCLSLYMLSLVPLSWISMFCASSFLSPFGIVIPLEMEICRTTEGRLNKKKYENLLLHLGNFLKVLGLDDKPVQKQMRKGDKHWLSWRYEVKSKRRQVQICLCRFPQGIFNCMSLKI